MNTPAFLIGVAILFWGWQGDNLLVALGIAVAIEGARAATGRIELTEKQQFRVADLSTVLAIVAGATFVATSGFPRSVVLLFYWLPVVLLPLALMQAWGTEREIALKVLFWSMRRVKLREPSKVNLGYPYLLLWLLAASAAPERGPAFDAALALLVAWALWPLRPGSGRTGAWIALVLVAATVGYGGSLGLRNLQLWIEANAPEWIAGSGTRVNPYRGMTDIGRFGELKQSDAIVLRVRADTLIRTPLLLHQASYVEYGGRDWIARGGSFEKVAPAGAGRSWKLGEGTARSSITVDEFAPHGDPVLSLPAGTVEVTSARLRSLKRNPLGAVQGEAPPGFVEYRIGLDRGAADRVAPTAPDLRIPAAEREAMLRVARLWEIEGLDPAAVVEKVRSRFVADYSYATFQEETARGRTPLGDFLERRKAGHCEHFASATTLLLRAAGVPARYATGYSVQEWSDLEKAWIARERHSHAWVRAWVDGRWIDVDTTPPTWIAVEGADRPATSALADAWSWARFRATRWIDGASRLERGFVFGLPALLLLMFIAWRLSRLWRRPSRRPGPGPATAKPVDFEGSAFFPVARLVESLGAPRQPHETSREWIARVSPRLPGDAAELSRLLELHYRWRFDPQGLEGEERAGFTARAAWWVRQARDAARRPGQ